MVNQAQCTDYGLVHGELKDRHFLIVNATTGKFLTARQLPKMMLIETEINHNKLTLMCEQGQPTIISRNLDNITENAKIVRTRYTKYDLKLGKGFC
jgi:uncharacterized protein YcbX